MATTEEDPDAFGPVKPVTDRTLFKGLVWLVRVMAGAFTAVAIGKMAVWMWNWPIW